MFPFDPMTLLLAALVADRVLDRVVPAVRWVRERLKVGRRYQEWKLRRGL